MNEEQLNQAIQRWRDAAEEDLKLDDFEQFRSVGSTCLSQGEGEELLRFLQDERNQSMVRSMGCVLLAPLINHVAQKGRSVHHCDAAIVHLMKTCSPDDLLHSLVLLIEDIDPGAISETILVLLPHLQTVLLSLQQSRAAAVGRALCSLQQQLSRLPVPFTLQQEEEDEHGLCRCCSALTTFTQPFILQVTTRNQLSMPEVDELRRELLQFCLRSLRDPLLEAELHRGRRSSLWLFATEIMVTLASIQEPLSELLLFNPLRRNLQADSSREARACLAYLLFVQLISMDSFPAVFSPMFILQCNMEHIDQLLSSKKESHLLKGLALCRRSLENVQDDSLPVSLLELRSFYSVPQNLKQLLTDCPLQHLRESGLKVFQLFIDKLDVEAKHKFFRCMLNTSRHAGVESYIVKNIRTQVEASMQPGRATVWFLGEELLTLLRLVLSLPQGADTDLLSGMDRIMESLNLLRYLLIRDKELRTRTDVWNQLCRSKDQYLKMLRVCIGFSRSYYSSELKALREDQKLRAKEARDAGRSMMLVKKLRVKQGRTSDMTLDEQLQVLQSALVTFDLMESLIVRIEEITEEKLQIPNSSPTAEL